MRVKFNDISLFLVPEDSIAHAYMHVKLTENKYIF